MYDDFARVMLVSDDERSAYYLMLLKLICLRPRRQFPELTLIANHKASTIYFYPWPECVTAIISEGNQWLFVDPNLNRQK